MIQCIDVRVYFPRRVVEASCNFSIVACAVDRNDSGIPASFAAFWMLHQPHSKHQERETYYCVRISVDSWSQLVLIAECTILLEISISSPGDRAQRLTASSTSVQKNSTPGRIIPSSGFVSIVASS
jgi:hypothetical protein